ncbi:PREDICTED: killer cell immunoglobulin-like receptor 3DL1, partial [Galeopterus variegatus]|uniref:Killer cell immunoglobulin-like receptor 3DL1 n=1 Tax=Galeopterus variegatus TaxID=482537 RepID=A0ABM0SJ92_GALVR
VYRKPSLLAQLGTLVKSGGNLTLQCFSETVFEKFILVQHRSGATENTLHLAGELHHGSSQANFSMNPVTSAHAGTYKCYGSVSHSPYEWSDPSDPLDIVITDNSSSLHVLIGPSVVTILLAILLFFLIRRCCPAKKSKSQEEESSAIWAYGDPKGEDPQEVICAQLDHWILTRKKITPTSQRPKEPSTDTSVYVELAKS